MQDFLSGGLREQSSAEYEPPAYLADAARQALMYVRGHDLRTGRPRVSAFGGRPHAARTARRRGRRQRRAGSRRHQTRGAPSDDGGLDPDPAPYGGQAGRLIARLA